MGYPERAYFFASDTTNRRLDSTRRREASGSPARASTPISCSSAGDNWGYFAMSLRYRRSMSGPSTAVSYAKRFIVSYLSPPDVPAGPYAPEGPGLHEAE